MDGRHVEATVRVTGPPNSNFLVGYPGISATMVCYHSNSIHFIFVNNSYSLE